MYPKTIIFLAVLFMATLNEGKPTFGVIIQTIKQSVSYVRCKLHKFGSSIVEHKHPFLGDPCGEHTPSTTTPSYKIIYVVVSPSPTYSTSEFYPNDLDIDVRLPQENTII